ncbi:PREDICTED: chromodomain-helicase-DNA-binding protein Mi-2 homolog [Cyphomyrmex costatus]|uniref:chromodomain-helicase-DNA-binding protein Mi-2 homolog n=1 Tax=Cyphomyrmex costatus TaxID=456900 RepID=UPI00085241FB|nr:PREDICTED: chromodomain-helicase-DNA-binding protein Mi-2 homolog [Cyphomyrmex costatus]XP_018405419.1 PREDICTED: chromodomain-helicase-DNA-binding protein Mi-2 homolog [Cyphomyrmex costatus]XP_018405420.1 PREDICTED: chromodomain-helicase-DNA-binding protein Mi-2 homolog [Cyphomyrmex costatus]XP_018405421.1 PREDICTED: chromodomain-helicase-DNA-binding protein Mi-2 homolog [Cyphomyrmex costatus]
MTKMQQHPVQAAPRITHEDHILEAIDQLRRRKARPDADRICNYLLRNYAVDARDTIADLHRLIEVEKVIQVDYKGNTSYRNAKKWTRLQLFKNRPEGFLKEKLNSSMVSSAVAELVVEEPDYLDQGVPAGRLIEQLLDGVSSPTSRRVVEEFLGREVACGNLARLANGNYSLVATSDMTTDATPSRRGGDSQPSSSAAVACVLEHGNATQRRVGKEAATNGTVSTNGITTKATKTAAAIAATAAELYEFNETDNLTDTTSNTSRSSSRQANDSPKLDRQLQQQNSIKKKECYEVNDKKNVERGVIASPLSVEVACNGGVVDGEKRERSSLIIATPTSTTVENYIVVKDEPKSNDVQKTTSNLKRSAKAERKQRLFARTDDRMDIEIKFEDYQQSKDEREKREETGRRSSEDHEDEDAGRSSSTNTSPTPSNVNASGFRSARRKRARKVFDPSDNNLVKRKRGRPGHKNSLIQDQDSKTSVKDGPFRQCSLCAKEKQEALVACRDCTVRAHPSCIYSPEEMLQKANSNWQCERCKTCAVCCETSDAGPLVTCYNCDDAYHYFCHPSRVTIKSNSKWHCNECTQKQLSKMNDSQNTHSINGTSRPDSPSSTTILPPVLSPQVSPMRGSSDQIEEDGPKGPIDLNIPDARNWTSEQVYQYFARLFPKDAEVFRQQDIDGHALLMMSRKDVVSGLNLLLGPALKIYRHVLKLQFRRDDPELYWQ